MSQEEVLHSSRLSGADRRKQLIEVAIDLFSRKGFAGTTTREIAAAAGVTEAIIFRHFQTKSGFYNAILDYIKSVEPLDEWLSEAQTLMDDRDDEGLLRLLVTKIIGVSRRHPKMERLIHMAALEGHELAALHMQRFNMPIGMKFAEYIGLRQREGAIRPGDPFTMLLFIAGGAQFYSLHRFIHTFDPCPDQNDDTVISDFTRYLVHGLLLPQGKQS